NQPDPVRLAGRVTRAFLGLRLDCAQCHDHPFANWSQGDFQGFSAFFGQTHLGLSGVFDGPGEYEVANKKTKVKHVVAPHVPFASELLPQDGTRRGQLAAWVTDARNPYFARAAVNRIWALLLGRPLVEPVDNLEAEGTPPPALSLMADDFAKNGFDVQRLIRLIVSTEVFGMESAADHEVTEADDKAWAIFPLTRLRPEQVAGSILQAASVSTIDAESHIFVRLFRFGNEKDFVRRYGDSGEDEFAGRGGTIPQRLLMMNGKMMREKIADSPVNAATRIGWMSADDRRAVENAYLTVLTRRPTAPEAGHFEAFLAEAEMPRGQRMEDLYWALVNSTEFSWNH
ncbi:MAG: DUF1553 domain-containing protein, partial [Candidatus Acidiferrum sp.]